MPTDSKTADLGGIDLIKLAMAYCVVAIHAESWRITAAPGWPLPVEWVIRMGVPFFFMATGFFTAGELERKPDRRAVLMKHSRRRFVLFLKWVAIYVPAVIATEAVTHCEPIEEIAVRFFLSGSCGIAMFLWFICSTAVVFLLAGLACRFRGGLLTLAVLFILAYFAGWAGNNIEGAYNMYVDALCTGAFRGGIYMAAGAAVYRFRDLIRRRRAVIISALLVVSAMLFFHKLPLGELCGGAALLVAGLTAKLRPSPLYIKARRLSAWIYFTHGYWMAIALIAAHLTGMALFPVKNMVFMAAGATATSLLIMHAARRRPRLAALIR